MRLTKASNADAGPPATTGTEQTGVDGSSWRRFRNSLNSGDWKLPSGMLGFIVVLHVLGLKILFGFVIPQHYRFGGDHPALTVGVGVPAYTFGLRHAL